MSSIDYQGKIRSNPFVERFFRRLQDNNPFYFISAGCMLGGCLAITNSLSWSSIPIGRLLTLIGTLNLYEAALIALAFYLIRRRQLARDGLILLVLEAFFLIDITFLNAEIVTSRLGLGLLVNAVLFVAAVAKLAVIGSLVGLPWRDGRFAAMVVQLGALFALPIVFRWVDHGDVSARVFYAAWWTIGLMIPLGEVIAGARPGTAWARRTAKLYAALPWLSLVLHVSILHYVYNAHFYAADLGPVLLGLAFALRGAEPSTLLPKRDLAVLRFLLPAASVGVSMGNPLPLCFGMGTNAAIWVTPDRLAVAAAYLAYVYLYLWPFAVYFLGLFALGVLMFVTQPTLERFWHAVWGWGDRSADYLWRAFPKTTVDWGMMAIGAAFAFLGIGAAVSLRRGQIEPAAPSDSAGA